MKESPQKEIYYLGHLGFLCFHIWEAAWGGFGLGCRFCKYYPKRKGHNLPCKKIILVSQRKGLGQNKESKFWHSNGIIWLCVGYWCGRALSMTFNWKSKLGNRARRLQRWICCSLWSHKSGKCWGTKKLCKLFKNNWLKIEITANNAVVIDILDVTMDIMTGNYNRIPIINPMLHCCMFMPNQTIQRALKRTLLWMWTGFV